MALNRWFLGILIKRWPRVCAWTGTFKNPTKCLWQKPDRRFYFFNPHAHLWAVTYITQISLDVTLSNRSHSWPWQENLTSKRGKGSITIMRTPLSSVLVIWSTFAFLFNFPFIIKWRKHSRFGYRDYKPLRNRPFIRGHCFPQLYGGFHATFTTDVASQQIPLIPDISSRSIWHLLLFRPVTPKLVMFTNFFRTSLSAFNSLPQNCRPVGSKIKVRGPNFNFKVKVSFFKFSKWK